MKKLLLFLLLILPICVKADMGSPYTEPYEAYVTAVDGTKYYDYEYEDNNYVLTEKGSLNYNEIIEITYEQKINGELYGTIIKDDEFCYVKLSDFESMAGNYTIDNKTLLEQKEQYSVKILVKEGIAVHSGPAYGYEVVANLTEGDIVKVLNNHSFAPWYYVDYGEGKGWICQLYGTFGKEYDEEIYIAIDTKLYEYGSDKTYRIPANTIINSYYSLDEWSRGYYVTYKGISGKINYNNTAYIKDSNDKNIKITKETKLYEAASNTSKVLVESVPKDIVFKYDYIYYPNNEQYVKVNYKGIEGWILVRGYIEDGEDSDGITKYKEIIHAKETNEKETIFEDIKEPGEIKPEDDVKEPELIEPGEEEQTNPEDAQKPAEPEEFEIKDKITGKQIVILCVLGSIILALTVTVIIMLVNKNKKSKKVKNNSVIEPINEPKSEQAIDNNQVREIIEENQTK